MAGADGCPAGWIVVARTGRRWSAFVTASLGGWLRHHPVRALVVDIPIGLLETGDRSADTSLRRLLGPRASSVFPAPLRSSLHAVTWTEACARRRAVDGKAYSRQSFNLFPRIREADRLVRRSTALIVEGHPEAAFTLMAGAPMRHSKKSVVGRAERVGWLLEVLPGCAGLLAAGPPRGARQDDLLDAISLVWSAARVARSGARRFPPEPPAPDRFGVIPQVHV